MSLVSPPSQPTAIENLLKFANENLADYCFLVIGIFLLTND